MMIAAAAILGLLAVFVARFAFGGQGNAAPAPATFTVVAAAKPLGFGDKIAAESLKLVELPIDAIPQGAFKTVSLAVGDGSRVSQRGIAINEVVVPNAISGTGNRLSTMGVIGGSMRAVTVTVTEASGVGGLVAPGDHVDVYITRTPPEKVARFDMVVPPTPSEPVDAAPNRPGATGMVAGGKEAGHGGPHTSSPGSLVRTMVPEGAKPQPITDMLIQDVRVLAIGQNVNVSSEKPEVVHSATLEVTPAQVAKLTLGQSVGTLALALRPLSDKDHTAVASLHVEDLHDGPARAAVAELHVAHVRPHVTHAAAPAAPTVEIIRDGASTHYAVPN